MPTSLTRLLLCLVLLLLPGLSWAQAPDDADLSRLSPRLRTVVAADDAVSGKKTAASVAPEIEALPQRAENGQSLYGVAIRTSRPDALRRAGIDVTSTYGDVALARVTADDLRTLSTLEGATAVRELGVARPDNDVAAGLSGVRLLNNGRLNDTAYTGENVLVCIIDTGIDYTHRDVRGLPDSTKSRLLYIWDQTLTAEPDEDTPADRGDNELSGYDYGVEYTRTDIEDDLGGQDVVRQEDTNGHGTHVTGTAAGNGGAHPERKYKGMAPDADIITVKAGNGAFPFAHVIDGMNYCGEVAADQDQPVVVNMSLGSQRGPHDGTTVQDEAVDNFVSSASGRAAVISAGNSGSSRMHTSSSISAGNTTTFDIEVPSSVSSGEFQADVWLSSDDDVEISMETPSGTIVGPVAPGDGSTTDSTADGEVYLVNTTDPDLGNGDRQLFLDVDDDNGTAPAEGTWTVMLNNTSSNTVTYHTWLWDSYLSGNVYANLVGGNSTYTIGTPGSSHHAVTLGSYAHRWRWCADNDNCYSFSTSFDNSDDISSFSSVGPLRKGTQKPEITAPGQGMGSSYSDDMGSVSDSRVLPGGEHRLSQGTSMSAPAATGAIALLFQEDPTLTYDEIKSTLQTSARTDAFTGGTPNDSWGYGKLDAVRAMTETIDGSATHRRDIIAHDDWGKSGEKSITGDEKIAVKFSPSEEGVASGVLLHPADTVDLSGPLEVEIWSDNDGKPDSPKGSMVSWDHNRLFAFTWNYLDLTEAGVSLQPDEDYHVVLSFSESGDEMGVRHDGDSVDDRSSIHSGDSWSSFSDGDLRLRPVISYSDVSGALPVELVAFDGRADGEAVTLSWTTTSETNNAGFVVEHKRDDGEFEEMGFEDGAGTTTESQSYRFRTSELEVGSHTFRLKQLDQDGTSTYSNTITVDLRLSDEYRITSVTPNPIRHTGTVSVTVKTSQEVQAEVYNTLGQRVAVLHDGAIEANTPSTMELGASLPSGVYFLRITGETFSTTKKFARVR